MFLNTVSSGNLELVQSLYVNRDQTDSLIPIANEEDKFQMLKLSFRTLLFAGRKNGAEILELLMNWSTPAMREEHIRSHEYAAVINATKM